jgi:glutathione S-transferase
LTIGESAAITAYLARRYSTSERGLLPVQAEQQAKWLEWCFFIVTELDSTSLYVMRRHGTKRGLAHIYGSAPEVVEKAGEYFRQQLHYVDVALSDGRTYLMGDQFTTADMLADDVSDLGNRLRGRHLRQGRTLPRAHCRTPRVPSRDQSERA